MRVGPLTAEVTDVLHTHELSALGAPREEMRRVNLTGTQAVLEFEALSIDIERRHVTRIWCERDGALLLHLSPREARRFANMHELPLPQRELAPAWEPLLLREAPQAAWAEAPAAQLGAGYFAAPAFQPEPLAPSP